jgi:hypothetical protein
MLCMPNGSTKTLALLESKAHSTATWQRFLPIETDEDDPKRTKIHHRPDWIVFRFAVAFVGVLVALFGVVLFYPLFGLLGMSARSSPLGSPVAWQS